MSQEKELMDHDEVITIESQDKLGIDNTTFQVGEFINFIKKIVSASHNKDITKRWTTGVQCKVLTPHKGWRKGKVKICLEFIPDEPESPLDDIRGTIKENT